LDVREPRYITYFYENNLAYMLSQGVLPQEASSAALMVNMDESNRMLDLVEMTGVDSTNAFITNTDRDILLQEGINYDEEMSSYDGDILRLASTTLANLNDLDPQTLNCPIVED